MPPIYYLNPPPNPFWDFVAGLEDHPFFRGPPRPHPHHEARPSPPPRPASTSEAPQPEMSEKAQGKQPYVEDPPEVDPSTLKPEPKKTEDQNREKAFPFQGRGRFADAFNEDNKVPEECRKGRGGPRCGGGRGRFGHHGPPPFTFGHPFFARPPWAGDSRGPPHEHHHPPPPGAYPPGPHPHGPPPPGAHPHGPPPFTGPPPFARGHHHRRPSPPHHRGSFDLGEFLNKLGSKLGIDLSNAAEGLGLAQDRFTAGRTSADVNFEPRADIFENKDSYTVHLSLPGAKKEDVGVEYEGDHCVLRITGVVHRPDVDEQMMSELVVDGRKRETGVFEKAIRLGTKRDPANIDVAGINAKMTDGVLVVRIPKLEQKEHKREVPIETAAAHANQPEYDDDYSEKPALFDAEDQTSVVASEAAEPSKREEISLIDMKDSEVRPEPTAEKEKKPSKAQEAEQERQAATTEEQLPAYSAENNEDDWERFTDDSGEGEYIKIDVK